MKVLKTIVKRMLFLGIILLCQRPVQAENNLNVVLELPQTELLEGKTAEVVVKLENYDETYTESITTILLEVYCDKGYLTIDEESILIDLDTGRGMGFSHAQKKNADIVELQYLNVADPLKKGTDTLFHFKVTAKQDVQKLWETIHINNVIIQDGTKETSERLETTIITKEKDKVVGQTHIPNPEKTETDSKETTAEPDEKDETTRDSGDAENTEHNLTQDNSETITNNENSENSESTENNETQKNPENSEKTEIESGSKQEESTIKNKPESETKQQETASKVVSNKNDKTSKVVWIVLGVLLAAGVCLSIKLALNKGNNKKNHK